MGAVSSCGRCCAEKPIRPEPTSVNSGDGDKESGSRRASQQSPSPAGSRKTTPRKGGKVAAHEGQKRANLNVKDGGFSLKNFAATNPGKLDSFYNVSSKIVGEGAFGKVHIAEDKSTKQMRAVKSIQKSATKECEKLQEEIEIIALLDHPHIVRLFESFEDARSIFLVMELCDGGELFERIIDAGSFSEEVAAHCVKQMLLAINYLHQNLIIHRDLKPENWLVATKDPVEKSTLKLIDFGISKRLKPGGTATSKAGTPNYVAPEVLGGRYNEKVDIWSTGVISFIMLSGLQPFPGRGTDDILQAVQRAKPSMDGPAWRKISQAAKGLLKALLAKSPSVRPSAVNALQHQWFIGMKNSQESEQFLSKIEIQNLKKFSSFNKVKKAALTVVASQLSDSRIDNLKKLFLDIDRNADGTLSIAELRQGLKAAGVKIPKDLAKVLEQVDTDGSGVLDYTEFLAGTMDRKLYSQESVVWAAFRKFDVDGSGSIDKTELMKVLGDDTLKDEMTIAGDPTQLQRIFEEIDVNGDGVIDFEEFFSMVRLKEDGARDAKIAEGGTATPDATSCRSPKGKSEKPASARRGKSPRIPGSPKAGFPKVNGKIGIASSDNSLNKET